MALDLFHSKAVEKEYLVTVDHKDGTAVENLICHAPVGVLNFGSQRYIKK